MSLDTAIAKIVSQYIPNTKGAAQQGWYLRLSDYATRRAAELAPPLTKAEIADLAISEPLSTDPSIAIHQILARVGHPVTFNAEGATIGLDPAAVIADASPEQNAELALLGFFGTSGLHAKVDYSLFEKYYEQDAPDHWQPKAPYANTGTWQAYMASKS